MATVTLRDLARHAGDVVDEVVLTGRPAVVTRNGRPVAALIPIDEEALEDFILARAPEFVEGRLQADAELVHGETTSLTTLLDKFGGDGPKS